MALEHGERPGGVGEERESLGLSKHGEGGGGGALGQRARGGERKNNERENRRGEERERHHDNEQASPFGDSDKDLQKDLAMSVCGTVRGRSCSFPFSRFHA